MTDVVRAVMVEESKDDFNILDGRVEPAEIVRHPQLGPVLRWRGGTFLTVAPGWELAPSQWTPTEAGPESVVNTPEEMHLIREAMRSGLLEVKSTLLNGFLRVDATYYAPVPDDGEAGGLRLALTELQGYMVPDLPGGRLGLMITRVNWAGGCAPFRVGQLLTPAQWAAITIAITAGFSLPVGSPTSGIYLPEYTDPADIDRLRADGWVVTTAESP